MAGVTPDADDIDQVFAALANTTRRTLLRVLVHGGPQPVNDLAARFELSRPSVSEHLKILRDAGLVSEKRSGRQRIYQLEAAPLMEIQEWLQPYEQFWRERLKALHALLDEDPEEPDSDTAGESS